jgi:hypothetical protein
MTFAIERLMDDAHAPLSDALDDLVALGPVPARSRPSGGSLALEAVGIAHLCPLCDAYTLMLAVDVGSVVYADDADNCIARWHNVLVIIRRGRQTLENIEHTRRAAREYLLGAGRKIGLLHVYEPAAELPDRACRHATAQIFAEVRSQVACAAIVFEGDGLRFAMMRVAVRALGALFGPSFPRFICTNVDDAAKWMQPILSSGGERTFAPSALGEAVARLRGGLNAS